MTPDDNFPEIKRDAVTTDELVAYAVVQATEYAMQHASARPQHERDAIVRLFVLYSFQRDRGEKVLLRHALDMVINRHRWEASHAA